MGGLFNGRRDNEAFEKAKVRAVAPTPGDDPRREECALLRSCMMLIADASHDQVDAWYCVLRASGMSLAQIGERDGGKSRQAVCKRFRKLFKREPVLEDYLGERRRRR